MVEPYATPRRFPRVSVLGGLSGTIVQQEVALVDLSEGGASFEHAGRFRLGSLCFLRLPSPMGEILLKACVVHSGVVRTTSGEGDEPTLFYRSGVEFRDLTPEAVEAIRQIIAAFSNPPRPA